MNQYVIDRQLEADEVRKRLGIKWRDGLQFLTRSTDSRYRVILAAHHWPHIITWSWFIDYAVPHPECRWWAWHFHKWTQNFGWGWRLQLGRLGTFSYHRQTTDWMLHSRHRIVNVIQDTEQNIAH